MPVFKKLLILIIFLFEFTCFSESDKNIKDLKNDVSNKNDQRNKDKNLFEKLENEKSSIPYLYVPTGNIYYKKVKVDTGLSYVSFPVKSRVSNTDSRKLVYPEFFLAIEYWARRYLGGGLSARTGFILTESSNLNDFFYYPLSGTVSLKYKIAEEYSEASSYFTLEIGYYYHNLSIEKKEDELFKKNYKGPFLGLEKRIALSENFGFSFKLDLMPYLSTSGFSLSDMDETSKGISFLAATYFTSKLKINKNSKYRLKLFLGFRQEDYFTEIKNMAIQRKYLNQKYVSYFITASQEF